MFKITLKALILLVIGYLLASCSAKPVSDLSVRKPDQFTGTTSNRVTLSDAYDMASFPTKGISGKITVEPYVDQEGETLMYFVNYDDGWVILSADKRTPAVIAQSGVGSISMSSENGGLISWLEMTAEDMKRIIHSEDSELTFTAEEIFSHRQEWAKASGKEPLRFQGDSLPIIPHYGGEWQLVSTWTEEVYYDSTCHLVQAHWDQWHPYNYYCPPKDSGSGKKPAGCAPVACGEMLQFLCNHFNYNLTLGWNGYYVNVNDVGLEYTDSLDNYATPLLLRIIGKELKAHYSDTSTGVFNSLTKIKNFYSSVGISSVKQSYSVTKITQNLLNGMPVLVSAFSSSSGHAFIIDGYKRTRTRYLEYYQKLSGYPPLLEERIDTVGYSSPHIYRIKMNWGWWTQWKDGYGFDDDWFALTGGWYVHSGDQYDQNINILCDYSFAL